MALARGFYGNLWHGHYQDSLRASQPLLPLGGALELWTRWDSDPLLELTPAMP